MRRIAATLIVAVVLAVLTATIVEAAMIRFYIVPLGTGETGNRGPGYIQFRGHPGLIVGQWCFMDYGAMLKKNYTNPSRGSHHYAKQSAFAGSLRELRGKILKIVMEKGKIHEADLIKNLQGDQRIDKVLEDLQKEGFVKRTRKHIHIADGF